MIPNAFVLFDGVCNLCNGAVQFIIKRDKKAYFQFASLQSDFAEKQLQNFVPADIRMNSIILIENGKIYRKSTAVFKVAKHLSGGWRLCYIFLILPRFLRDGLYNFIAKHRYQWFGKRNECMVPKPEWEGRFID